MADRRMRPHLNDRHMISERTARTLRTQANPLHIYRERDSRFAARRYTADFILHPDIEHSEEDEEETADILEAPESSRGGAALYDAYTSLRPSSTRLTSLDPVDRLRSTVTSPRPPSPPTPLIGGDTVGLPPPPPLSSVYLAPHGPSSLTRQRTLRRPATRTRAMDFNDFTSRRRSIVRQNGEVSEPVRAEDSADGTWRFSSPPERAGSSDAPSPSAHRLGRRFFPFTAWSDPHLRINPDNDGWTVGPGESSGSGHQSSSQLWHQFTGRPFAGERSPTTIPRLRRGGQPALESILPLRGYTSLGSLTPQSDDPSRSMDDRTPSRASSSTAPGRLHNSEMDALDEASRQLLTPRSISPAGEAFHL